MNERRQLLADAILVFSLVELVAQSSATATGVIMGRVTAAVAQAPLVGPTVRVLVREAVAQTDSSGRFTLRGVRTGIVRIEVPRLSYAPVIKGDIAV